MSREVREAAGSSDEFSTNEAEASAVQAVPAKRKEDAAQPAFRPNGVGSFQKAADSNSVMTDQERAARVEEIRRHHDGGAYCDPVKNEDCFLLAELDRVTAERDEARRMLQFARDGMSQLEGWRDAAIAELNTLRAFWDSMPKNIPKHMVHKLTGERDALRAQVEQLKVGMELAWGVIANAGWRGESKSPGWDEAAIRWRDEHWHPALAATAKEQG